MRNKNANNKPGPSIVASYGTRNKTKTMGAGTDRCMTTTTWALQSVPAVSGVSARAIPMDPFNPQVTSPVVNAIAGSYEFYRIVSASVEIIPIGGYQAPGSHLHCFVTSPEVMALANLGDFNDIGNIAASEQNSQYVPMSVTTRKTFSNNRITSRRWYACNFDNTGTSDDYDRTLQCMYVFYQSQFPDTQAPVIMNFHITYEFRGLGVTSQTTLLARAQDPVFPYITTDKGYPKGCLLRKRDGTTQAYLRSDPPPVPPTEPPEGPKPKPLPPSVVEDGEAE